MRAVLLGMAGATLARINTARSSSPELKVVIEAEFGHPTSTSAQAIETGILVAQEEINQALPSGFPRFTAVASNNSGVAAIAQDNFAEHARDPAVMAVFGGKFSPVQIEMVPLAQRLGLMLLDPWGSADGITDHGVTPSWTFRLSLKDSWAAPAFIDFARSQCRATRLGLLLPTTAWGRSNEHALGEAAAARQATIAATRWYSWGERSMVRRYQELRAAGAQAIVLVANEVEAAILVRELAALPAAERLPLICHWGITGGHFFSMAGQALRDVDLSVIQTFTFDNNHRPRAERLYAEARRRTAPPSSVNIDAVVGLAHAYDLMHILALAALQAERLDRASLRDAMERVPFFSGAVRDYVPPFTPARHDAELADGIFFARYDMAGALVPIRR